MESLPSWTAGRPEATTCVALGDVDRDGDLDLVCGNLGTSSFTVYRNLGSTLETAPSWTANDTAILSVALGDVDGDGDLDLVCGSSGQSTTLYRNLGSTFETVASWASEEQSVTRGVALGDVDGDGDLDLVCGGLGGTLYRNLGSSFETTPFWASERQDGIQDVALGDVDGDGDLDLVCGNYQSATLYRNLGATFETNPSWTSNAQVTTTSVALGDVDGDGDLDLVCGNLNESTTLHRNLGATFETTPSWASDRRDSTASVAFGDIEGDGDLDLVCGNYNQRTTLYRNLGATFDTTPSWASDRPGATIGVAFGDIDSDGDLDLVCGNFTQHTTLYRNRGSGFEKTPSWASDRPDSTASVALGDVDSDGDLDLVCGNFNQRTTLYRNLGSSFEATPSWASDRPEQTRSVALGDIDGDGNIDLVCGNYNSSLSLYRNLGGTFERSPSWLSDAQSTTVSVALGDVDADGDLDLVCGNFGRTALLFRNLGSTFEFMPSWGSGRYEWTSAVTLGDVDADGDLDLICGNLGQSTTLYRNLGSTFETPPSWESARLDWTSAVTLGDVDGDGDLDLVCGNLGQSTTLYRNLGSTFEVTPSWASDRQDSTTCVALGDVDGDSDLDLVCGNARQSTTLYRNLGSTFEATPCWTSGRQDSTSSVVLGDADGDGDVDLLCGNVSAPTTMLYRSTARPPFRGDPVVPTHYLPNNAAHIRWVRIVRRDPNVLRIQFTAIDVEADPVWIVADYAFRGTSSWVPIALPGGEFGPLGSSASGIQHMFDWDLLRFPSDGRDVVLRLRAISVPRRAGLIQHVSAYVKDIGRIVPFRPEIRAASSGLDFPTVTQGDTVSVGLEIRNTGTDTLRVTGFAVRPVELRVAQSTPLGLAPGQIRLLQVLHEPVTGLENAGTLDISSNDPFTPILSLPVRTDVRALGVRSRLLAPGGEVHLGEAVTVLVTPEPEARVEGGALRYTVPGPSGGVYSLPLSPSYGEFLAVIPSEHVSEAGLSYYIEAWNPPAVTTDPPGAPDSAYVVTVPAPQAIASVQAEPNSGSSYLENREIRVLVVLERGTVAESVSVYFRRGGESTYRRTSVEARASVTAVPIPAEVAGPRGVEYWVETQTLTRTLTEPPVDPWNRPHVIPVTVQNLAEPAAAAGTRYRLVSVPLDFGSDFTGTLASLLSDQAAFGPYATERWRSFRWIPSTTSYSELSASNPDHWVKPGKAFWLIARGSSRIDTAPIPGTSTPTGGKHAITLLPGWNQIANPFAFSVAWASVAKSDSQLIGAPVAWDPQCGASGDYAPCGQHSPDAVPALLIPFEGYFIENKSSEPETLWVPPVEASPAFLAGSPDRESLKSGSRVETLDSWVLRLQARTATAMDGSNILGVDPDALEGYDRLDQGKPPVAPGPWVRVAFVHEDWDSFSGLYRRDLRGAGPEGHVWQIEVRSEQKAEEIALQLISETTPPRELAIRLVDQELGVSSDLVLAGGELEPYRLVSYGRERAYSLTLVAGTAMYVERSEVAQRRLPGGVELDRCVPNPFNGVTRIRFGLPEARHVTLSVYTVRGDRVVVLRQSEPLRAGYHVSLWRGTDERNNPVGSGVYFCRLESGRSVLTQRVVLIR